MKRYTDEQIRDANSVDLAAYLEARGYAMKREGSQMRLAEHESLYIRGNQWFWFSQRKGGKTLSFITEYEGIPFVEAMKILTGEEPISDAPLPKAKPMQPEERKLLPYEPASNNNALFAYLKSRGIDARIIKRCVDDGTLFQSNMFWMKNKETGEFERCSCAPQVIFAGKDANGHIRYETARSCKGNGKHDAYGSDKAFSFAMPEQDCKVLWVFESGIDALSHATLCGYSKQQYRTHRLSLGGFAAVALEQYLKDYPEIKYVNLALDNDVQGREATESLAAFLKERYTVYDHPPVFGKDYNEDLQLRQEQFRERVKARQQPER